MSLTYLVPVCYIAFTGKDVNPDFAGYDGSMRGEASKPMLVPLVLTACVSVLLGVFPDMGAHLLTFAQQAAAAVFEGGLL